MILRRRGIGVAASAAVSTLGFVLLASWLWFASSTTAGVPGGSTWTALTDSLRESWDAFQDLSAPVPVLTGFVVAAAFAVFFAVFLADWAAFRLWSPVESLVPALTLFLFCSLLGSEQQRMTSAFLFCAASLVYLLAHRVARLETSSGWLTADIDRGSQWLFRAGTALAAVAVIGGVVVGPRLPTANDSAIFDYRDGDGDGPSSRVTVSPLVDIRGRLVEQSDLELFTVESPEPAYWRLTALDEFDGEIWRSGGNYGETDGDLGAEVPDLPTAPLTQTYTIERLDALWLPAAYQPVTVETEGPKPIYQRESSTLIVDRDFTSSDNSVYTVTSARPTPTDADLQNAVTTLDPDLASYLDLPGNFSSRAAEVAADAVATAGARTAYDKAMALQDFFRDQGVFAADEFEWTYSLDERNGHDVDAIEAFLDTNRGYCEMFAGTYAAMARSVGLPSRVAVGFTWGELDGENLYRVKGKYAHAWPEVWLGDDVGWIAFEPTPDRGAPEMEAYNRVTPSQSDGTPEGTTGAPSTTTTTPSSTSTTSSVPGDPADLDEQLDTAADPTSSGSDDGLPFVVKLGIAALALLALVSLYVVATLGYGTLHRRRRRERATSPNDSVTVAWEESLDDLELLGIEPRTSESHSEFAERVGWALPERRDDIDELAGLTDQVTYGFDDLADADVSRADDAARAIADTVHAKVSWRTRWRHRLDPRNLGRTSKRAMRQSAQSSRA
jgi:transglutaminase-like putative cysteine protease